MIANDYPILSTDILVNFCIQDGRVGARVQTTQRAAMACTTHAPTATPGLANADDAASVPTIAVTHHA